MQSNHIIETEERASKRLIAAVFVFFFLLNILTSGGHLDWWDGMEAFLVTESMAIRNSVKLHPDSPTLEQVPFDVRYTIYSNKVIQTGNSSLDRNTIPLEPVYTVRSILLSAVGVPFYHLALALSVPPIELVGLLVNSFLISLTSLVVFCFSREVFRSNGIAFSLSLVYGVCSFVWPYHTSFWTQPLQGLTLISSLYFLYIAIHHRVVRQHSRSQTTSPSSYEKFRFKGRSHLIILAGFILGLAIISHPSSLIFVPGFVIYAFISLKGKHPKGLFIWFLTSLLITSLFVGLTNYWRFGSFTEFGYGYFASLETHNGWAGLIGLLLSPGAGLVFFFPISVMVILAAKYMYSANRGLLLICSYVIIANWLHVGTLSFGSEPYSWSGAIAWGPRYFVPILPFIVIILGQLLSSIKVMRESRSKMILKISVIGLIVVGFYVNLVGTLVWYQYGIVYAWDKDQLAKFPNSIDIITWNPYYSPIVLHTKALLTDYVSTILPEKYEKTSWYWMTYGLAPCSYDNYIFCKFGIVMVIIVSMLIILTGVFILKQIGKEKRTQTMIH
jgi:hypothetical protein